MLTTAPSRALTDAFIRVRLSEAEWQAGADGGLARARNALVHRRERHDGSPVFGMYENNIRGAHGEIAVCRAFGLTWDPTVGQLGQKDAGPYQVRSTWREDGHLILHEHELASDDVFIFVTGDGFDYVLRGWIVGTAAGDVARRENFDRRTGGPRKVAAYWVEQAHLWSMDELPTPAELAQRLCRSA